jgi:hypothetical protein
VEKADGDPVATAVWMVFLVACGVALALALGVARSQRIRAVRDADALSGWNAGLDALDRIDQRHHR